MTTLSKRIERVEPSPTLAVSARAKAMQEEGIDVVSFGAGEPDFDTPEPIREAAKSAIDAGKTRYTPTPGLPKLRAAIADDYQRRGRTVEADEVVVTVGGKQALYNATQVLFEEGDKVLVPAPYWVSYPAQLHLCGATPVAVETSVDGGYRLDPKTLRQRLENTPEARGLILCSPSNPTGATYTTGELEALAEVLMDYPQVTVFFDAIYDRLYYEGDIAPDLLATAPQLEDRVITFNGFSKTFAMTGWRLGYAIGPTEVIDAMGTLQSQSTSNATSFAQYGAIEALQLDDAVIESRRDAFERRRDLIVSGLDAIDGVDCPSPSGAFYVFPDFSAYTEGISTPFDDDMALTEYLLEQAQVAVVPGSAFGAPGGLRLSYAMDSETIQKGVDRITSAIDDV